MDISHTDFWLHRHRQCQFVVTHYKFLRANFALFPFYFECNRWFDFTLFTKYCCECVIFLWFPASSNVECIMRYLSLISILFIPKYFHTQIIIFVIITWVQDEGTKIKIYSSKSWILPARIQFQLLLNNFIWQKKYISP